MSSCVTLSKICIGLALDGGGGIGVHLFFLPQLLCHNQIIEFSFCLFPFKGFL